VIMRTAKVRPNSLHSIARVGLAAFAILFGVGSWWVLYREHQKLQSDFVLQEPSQPMTDETDPVFLRETVTLESDLPMVHAGTMVELPDASLLAVWFGGTAEGDNDVFLYTASRGADGVWSEPRLLLDREQVIEAMKRHVVSLGNPVLVSLGQDKVALLFVTISAGRWSGSSINVVKSSDGGQTWGQPQKLALGPFFNLSDLPRNPPVPLSGGNWLIPIYHEFMGKFPEVLRINLEATRPAYVKSRMFGGLAYLQPTIAALSPERAVAFYRDFTSARRTFRADSFDAGRTWSRPQPTDLPNPDSAVCTLRLPDGRLLLAFNDSTDDRHALRLALSGDEGRSWQRLATIDEGSGRDVCYPYLILGSDGRIRMLYTYRGRYIRYAEFNVPWINSMARSTDQGGAVIP